MGIFKSIKKAVKKVVKNIPGVKLIRSTTKPIRKAIGGIFKGRKIDFPEFPGTLPPAAVPTFAQAGGPASRGGVAGASIGISLISSGSPTGLKKRSRTNKRTLIGGA